MLNNMMFDRPVVIIGGGAQAKYCQDIFQYLGREISAVFDPIGKLVGSRLMGLVISKFDKENFWSDESVAGCDIIIALSDPFLKKEITEYLENNRSPINVIHPTASIAGTSILGQGCIVNAGAVIQPYATVGKGCMIHSGVVVEHDCKIGDYVNIAMNVALAGKVKIGDFTTIYTGSVVGPNTTIGAGSVVGAGAVVLKDLPDNVLAYGQPAKVVRKLSEISSSQKSSCI